MRTGLYAPIKAGLAARMAGSATFLIYGDPDDVLITIGPHIDDGLCVARRFALLPKLLPRPGPVPGIARFDGEVQGLLVHPGKHEHHASVLIGANDRDQAISIELRGEGVAFLKLMLVGV